MKVGREGKRLGVRLHRANTLQSGRLAGEGAGGEAVSRAVDRGSG